MKAPLAFALGVLACLCPRALGQPGGEIADEIPRGGIARVVYELRQAEDVSSEDLLNALVLSGPRGLSGLLDLLEGVAVEGVDPLDAKLRRSAREAFSGLPSLVRTRRAAGDLSQYREDVESSISLRVMGSFGSAQDLPIILGYLRPPGGEHELPAKVKASTEEALTALLSRDRRAFSVLTSLFPGQTLDAKESVLRAVGSHPSKASLEFLVELLDRERDLTSVLLSQIGRVIEVEGIEVDGATMMFVQRELVSQDPRVLREACQALGRIGQIEAVGDLIGLLEHSDPVVATTAHWALERITRMRMSPERSRWQRWWSKEQVWWSKEAAGALDRLRDPNPGQVGAALRDVSSHMLYRVEISRAVLPLLQDQNTALVAQACSVLQVLRSREAVAPLEALIARGKSPFLVHAEAALKSCRP